MKIQRGSHFIENFVPTLLLPLPGNFGRHKNNASFFKKRNFFQNIWIFFNRCKFKPKIRDKLVLNNLALCNFSISWGAYLLQKVIQMCLLIIALLPFLITSTSVMYQVCGEVILMPVSNSSNIITNNTQQTLRYLHSGYALFDIQNSVKPHSKTKYPSNTNKNSFTELKYVVNSITPTYNLKKNGYSLIILGRSKNSINLLNFTIAESTESRRNAGISSDTSNSQFFIPKNIRYKRDTHQEKFAKRINNQKINGAEFSHIIDKQKLTQLVMTGLGLQKLPDMSKANISQLEYASKYVEYLQRRQNHQNHGKESAGTSFVPVFPSPTLHLFSIATNQFSDISYTRWHNERGVNRNLTKRSSVFRNKSNVLPEKTNIFLFFPLNFNNADITSESIDEANVRLMLLYSSSLAAQRWKKRNNTQKFNNNISTKKKCFMDPKESSLSQHIILKGVDRKKKNRSHKINLKVYQRLSHNKRELLDVRQLEIENVDSDANSGEKSSQWLEFDVTKAVRGWVNRSHENLGLEIQCDKCRRIGARILNDISPSEKINEDGRFHLRPVLNVIGHLGQTHSENGVQHLNSTDNQLSIPFYQSQSQNKPNSCYKSHQRCCRHRLDVVFKDIKGFEFIIQPKTFDAGYCQGRCSPRHNPAHHHALLQSLIWQQDHKRVPRPCCAPSMLQELDVLHVDEEHSDKLKISTWSDMQVIECACS